MGRCFGASTKHFQKIAEQETVSAAWKKQKKSSDEMEDKEHSRCEKYFSLNL